MQQIFQNGMIHLKGGGGLPCNNWLARGNVLLLKAKFKVGKSLFAQQLMATVTTCRSHSTFREIFSFSSCSNQRCRKRNSTVLARLGNGREKEKE
jgi:hypothetical protein